MAIEIVDFPVKNGDFPWQNVSSPEGNLLFWDVNKYGWASSTSSASSNSKAFQGIPMRHSPSSSAANRWIRFMAWHGKWQSFMWLTMVNHGQPCLTMVNQAEIETPLEKNNCLSAAYVGMSLQSATACHHILTIPCWGIIHGWLIQPAGTSLIRQKW